MNAIGITYPQYWMALDMKATFPSHLALMNAIFVAIQKQDTLFGFVVGPFLDLV